MIIGRSLAIQRALGLADRYARSKLPILLLGATGTGKELFAQHIHRLSGRRGTVVDVNCAALPRDMVESLLFGHCRGAFTGAMTTTVGLVEQADGGTLFLDEVGSLPLELQGKLLRVLETGEVRRLGAGMKRQVDLRVIAAAQPDLNQAIGADRFRRDLFQRLAGVLIELPPLVDRPEDIVSLAEHFARLGGLVLEPGVEPVLRNYSWPGNARELRLAIERAGHLAENGTIPPAVVAEAIELGIPAAARRALPGPIPGRLGDWDRFVAICSASGWHATRIARALGIARSTLFYRLKLDGVSLRRLRESKSNGQSWTLLD